MPAGIAASQRNRPAEISGVGQALTRNQLIGRAMSEKAVGSGKLSADNVAALVMAALQANQFYIYCHPQALASVRTRMDDVLAGAIRATRFMSGPKWARSCGRNWEGFELDLIRGLGCNSG